MTSHRTASAVLGVGTGMLFFATLMSAFPSSRDLAIAECNDNARDASKNFRAVNGPTDSPKYAEIEKTRQACVLEATLK